MKIIYNNIYRRLHFGDLKIGDVFADEDNDVCMKISAIDNNVNAVSLERGTALLFLFEEEVTPLNCELIVNK